MNHTLAAYWLKGNAIGLAAFVLSLVALMVGVSAYRTAIQRDGQARAIPLRLERGETELAAQHQKGVAVLSELANVLRSITYIFAAGGLAIGLSDARRRHTSLWLFGATIVVAVTAVGLAMGSRT